MLLDYPDKKERDRLSRSFLFQFDKLSEIDFKRNDRHSDLPSFQNLRMEFTDYSKRFACHEDPAGAAFEI